MSETAQRAASRLQTLSPRAHKLGREVWRVVRIQQQLKQNYATSIARARQLLFIGDEQPCPESYYAYLSNAASRGCIGSEIRRIELTLHIAQQTARVGGVMAAYPVLSGGELPKPGPKGPLVPANVERPRLHQKLVELGLTAPYLASSIHHNVIAHTVALHEVDGDRAVMAYLAKDDEPKPFQARDGAIRPIVMLTGAESGKAAFFGLDEEDGQLVRQPDASQALHYFVADEASVLQSTLGFDAIVARELARFAAHQAENVYMAFAAHMRMSEHGFEIEHTDGVGDLCGIDEAEEELEHLVVQAQEQLTFEAEGHRPGI